jgi:hypothetical protein
MGCVFIFNPAVQHQLMIANTAGAGEGTRTPCTMPELKKLQWLPQMSLCIHSRAFEGQRFPPLLDVRSCFMRLRGKEHRVPNSRRQKHERVGYAIRVLVFGENERGKRGNSAGNCNRIRFLVRQLSLHIDSKALLLSAIRHMEPTQYPVVQQRSLPFCSSCYEGHKYVTKMKERATAKRRSLHRLQSMARVLYRGDA